MQRRLTQGQPRAAPIAPGTAIGRRWWFDAIDGAAAMRIVAKLMARAAIAENATPFFFEEALAELFALAAFQSQSQVRRTKQNDSLFLTFAKSTTRLNPSSIYAFFAIRQRVKRWRRDAELILGDNKVEQATRFSHERYRSAQFTQALQHAMGPTMGRIFPLSRLSHRRTPDSWWQRSAGSPPLTCVVAVSSWTPG
jgi:hypothetical protein